MINDQDSATVMAIARNVGGPECEALRGLLDEMTTVSLEAGQDLMAAGEANGREYFVLTGIMRTYMCDYEGVEVTLSFHVGPAILTPAVARTAGDVSLVSCQALTPARLASFPATRLVTLMTSQPAMGRWGDRVLQGELERRVHRERTLIALNAAQRLEAFRKAYPRLEDHVAHYHIASYLGITPTSLSRLRRA